MQQSICLEAQQYDCKIDYAYFELVKSIEELSECETLNHRDIDYLKLAYIKLRKTIAKYSNRC